MKPIRLRKDDVVHTVHSGPARCTLATGLDLQRTLANPNGFGWPSCWVCTERRMKQARDGIAIGSFGEAKWIPVEGYGVVDVRENEEDLRAECTHGNPGGRVYPDTKTITMPRSWSEVKKRHKRASLIFFVESSATPMGGNVVLF